MDILSHGVSFNADSAASMPEAAFTQQHLHLWPEVDEAERLARLAVVRKTALDLVGYIDFEMIDHESKGSSKKAGKSKRGRNDDNGSDEGAGSDGVTKPGAALPLRGDGDNDQATPVPEQ